MASQGITGKAPVSRKVDLRRIWQTGLLAIVAATVANLIIVGLANVILHPSAEFLPLQWVGVAVSTIIGVAGATIVFAIVSKMAQRPIRTFMILAVAAFVLTLIPDIALLLNPSTIAGTTVGTVGALLIMHITAAVISMGMLTKLSPEK
jgi:Family of unknown function (DUF6069)